MKNAATAYKPNATVGSASGPSSPLSQLAQQHGRQAIMNGLSREND